MLDKGLKILVAEDNDSNYVLLTYMLKGFALDRAVNGLIAVEKARQGGYDVILMDLRMPEMSGIEATQQIRAFDKAVPIIALTSNAFDSDRVEAIEAGCDLFLTKPIRKNVLMTALEDLFSKGE